MRLALLAVAPVLALAVATPAQAAAPERSGWWSRLAPLPAPLTMEGDLRITGQGTAATAYSAVLLTAPGATTATLDLLVRPGTAVGTGEVVACPTADADWEEGSNQPFDAAPAYDCSDQAFGTLSADGTTLTFLLDDSTQLSPGTWSLALVPAPEGSAPFAVDLQPPGPASFTPEAPATAEPPPASSSPPPVSTDTAAPPPFVESFDTGSLLPPADPGSGDTGAPLLAGTEPLPAAPAAAPGPQPAVASGPATSFPQAVAVRPVAQSLPGGERGRLVALLALVALSGAVGYALGQQRPGPRLIGGRAGAVRPPAEPGAVAASAAVPTPAAARERGIGRFARVRDAAPRRLR